MFARNIDAGLDEEKNYGYYRTVGSDSNARTVVPTLPGNWRCFYENIAAVLQARSEGRNGTNALSIFVSLRCVLLYGCLVSCKKELVSVSIPLGLFLSFHSHSLWLRLRLLPT